MPTMLRGFSGLACHSPSETLSLINDVHDVKTGNKFDSDPTMLCISLVVLRRVALAVHHAVASPMLHVGGARMNVTRRDDVSIALAQRHTCASHALL
eukprot:9874534-Heterocapsa_arctica.AAC.1